MYIRTLLLLLLLLTESSALAQTEYPVAPYTDFAYHLGDLLQGSRPLSFYRQSWRAYLETRPGWIFRDGKGINHTDFGGTRLNYGPTFQLLVNAGIKNYRIEIGWGNLHWNETDFYNMLLTKKYAAVLQLGSQYGLTPLIVFNANHGSPCPNLSAKYTLSGAYDATSTSLLLDRVDGIVPRYTGVTCFYDQMASKLITAVDPATNTVTLAEPLGAEARKIRDVDAQLPGIQVYLHTLKYQPFAPPGTAEFEATFGGWLQYLQFVLDFAVQQTGRDDFDVEIWNELSFGSSFLRIENYYEPDPTFPVDPVLAAQGKLNQRSADFLKANFPRLTVIDGFTNTNITANPRQEKTGGFDGQSYHPYSASRERIPATWPQAVDRNLFREGWPPPGDWTFAFPEGQQSTNLRLQNLPRNQLYPLRRVSFYPRALAGDGFWHYMTEHGQNPWEVDPAMGNAAANELRAKSMARYYLFWLHKGVRKLYSWTLYEDRYTKKGQEETGSGVLHAQSAGFPHPNGYTLETAAQYETPALRMLRNIHRWFLLSRKLTQPEQLTAEATALEPGPLAFSGDATHPDYPLREQLCLLPWQITARRFVIAVYLLTFDLQQDPGPLNFRLKLGNLPGTRTGFRYYDPLTETLEPVTRLGVTDTDLTLRVAVRDYPRLLILDLRRPADTTPPDPPQVWDSSDALDREIQGQGTRETTYLAAYWTASDPESGISRYQYRITKDAPDGTIIRNWAQLGIVNDGLYTSVVTKNLRLAEGQHFFSVRAQNGAGLWSTPGYSDGIWVDLTPPVITGLVINGGKPTTTSGVVNVAISATDAGSGLNATDGAEVRVWNETHQNPYIQPLRLAPQTVGALLTPGPGVKTISVRIRDVAGNWSEEIFGTVTRL